MGTRNRAGWRSSALGLGFLGAFAACSASQPSPEGRPDKPANGTAVESSTASLPETRAPNAPAPTGRLDATAPELKTEIVRDGPRTTRDQESIAREVRGLERLYGTTARGASERASVMLRLGATYVELVDAERLAGAPTDAALVQKAIALYTSFTQDYPNDPKSDEALYNLATFYERAGDLKNARKTYFELIKSRPDSGYIPNAYAAFGDMFFAEIAADPAKADLAKQGYMEVIKYPPPNNTVYGYAWYKLAQTEILLGNDAKALSALQRTIDFATQYATLPGAYRLALADAARQDLVFVYARAGKPDAAYAFFRKVAADETRTLALLSKLGGVYYDARQYAEAIRIFDDLAARDPTGSCRHRVMRNAAVSAQLPGATPATAASLARSTPARCP